jgi:hypothetical protein
MPLEWIYFYCLLGMIVGLTVFCLVKPARIFEYPYFMAITMAIFILPQAVSLIRFPGPAPETAIRSVLLMSCLCLGASVVGYLLKPIPFIMRSVVRPLSFNRLFHVGILFIACGFVFNYLLGGVQVEYSEKGGMTGIGTIYLFFGQLIFPGFCICLFQALVRPNFLAISMALIGAFIPLQTIVGGRREPAAMFVLMLAMGLFFLKRIKPWRWMILGAALFAMLAIPATGTYRGLQSEKDWQGISQIDLVGNFKSFVNDESTLELRNAAMMMEGTKRSGNYQYGKGYWNHLVFRFVPGQFVGNNLKSALMFEDQTAATEDATAIMGYDIPSGATITGMGDSFQQFGWFGCLFFAVLGWFFRSLWQAALQRGALFPQLLYILITTSAMRSITHWTLDFLPGLFFYLIFLGLAYWYAREPMAAVRRKAERQGADYGRMITDRRRSEILKMEADGGKSGSKSRRQGVGIAPFSVTNPEAKKQKTEDRRQSSDVGSQKPIP